MKEITSVRADPNVALRRGESAFTTTPSGIRKPIITTKGWYVQVRWNDQSISWAPLHLIKESNPIKVAEFVIANNLDQEPAFNWWVRKVIKKKDRIISKVKTRVRKTNKYKFGVGVPSTVQEALRLVRENDNDLWATAIEKEMNNSRVAFQLLDRDDKPPVGFKKIKCYLKFDVKWI